MQPLLHLKILHFWKISPPRMRRPSDEPFEILKHPQFPWGFTPTPLGKWEPPMTPCLTLPSLSNITVQSVTMPYLDITACTKKDGQSEALIPYLNQVSSSR